MLNTGIKFEKFDDLFGLEIKEIKNYSDVRGIKKVAKWANENEHDCFVEVTKQKVEYKDNPSDLLGISKLAQTLYPKF